MQEKHICNRYRGNGFGSTSAYTHDYTACEEPAVTVLEDEPDAADEVYRVTGNVDRPPTEFVGDGHPHEVACALEKCRRGEEEGYMTDGLWDGSRGAREEVHGRRGNGNGWPCGNVTTTQAGLVAETHRLNLPAARKLHINMAKHMTVAM